MIIPRPAVGPRGSRLLPIILWFAALVPGCGGGVNVTNGMISTTVVGDVPYGAPLTTAADDFSARPADGIAAAEVASWSLRPAAGVTIATITRAVARVGAVEYTLADDCAAETTRALLTVRVPGPFTLSLTDAVITPAIPDIAAPVGMYICNAFLPPLKNPMSQGDHHGMGSYGEWLAAAPSLGTTAMGEHGLELAGTLLGGETFSVRIPTPPIFVFATAPIGIDASTVDIELKLPISRWLDQIERLANEHGVEGPDMMIDEDHWPDLTDELGLSLPSQGMMRRRDP